LIDAEIANVTGRQKEGELRTETDLERKRPHRPGSRGGWPDAGQPHAGETARARERERATCVCVRVHAVLLGRTHGAHAIPGPPPHPLIVPRAGYYCASTAKGGAAGSKGRQATARVRLCNVLRMEELVVSHCHSPHCPAFRHCVSRPACPSSAAASGSRSIVVVVVVVVRGTLHG